MHLWCIILKKEVVSLTKERHVAIYDSILRDGAQAQRISFSVDDKIKIARELDRMGVDYIEAGNPGSNPKDLEFFSRADELGLQHARLSAFGSTRRAGMAVQDDGNVQNLLKANTPCVAIFGKSWDFHVTDILKTTLDENCAMIADTIAYLKSHGKEVIFDAEHFFDGYKNNADYAMKTLAAAAGAGADVLVLCDTNGAAFPDEISRIVSKAAAAFPRKIGIHCHNDCGMAVANSVLAVQAGAVQVQGTFTGYGERCGNANLSTVIANLQLKLGYDVIGDAIHHLTPAAYRINDISNVKLDRSMPYVGSGAFAHKGGMHIDAVCKDPKSFEHIDPVEVGNERRLLVSEVSGKSMVYQRVHKLFPDVAKDSEEVQKITGQLKELEHQGYQFEGADGTVELIIRKAVGKYAPLFTLNHFKTIGENKAKDNPSTALISISVDGRSEITAAEGDGPVNALDKALRKALEVFYPQIKHVRLLDYKVRVINTQGTASTVRVLIESTDGKTSWTTVGVSTDIIKASWTALVDSMEYKLIKDMEQLMGGR